VLSISKMKMFAVVKAQLQSQLVSFVKHRLLVSRAFVTRVMRGKAAKVIHQNLPSDWLSRETFENICLSHAEDCLSYSKIKFLMQFTNKTYVKDVWTGQVFLSYCKCSPVLVRWERNWTFADLKHD